VPIDFHQLRKTGIASSGCSPSVGCHGASHFVFGIAWVSMMAAVLQVAAIPQHVLAANATIQGTSRSDGAIATEAVHFCH